MDLQGGAINFAEEFFEFPWVGFKLMSNPGGENYFLLNRDLIDSTIMNP